MVGMFAPAVKTTGAMRRLVKYKAQAASWLEKHPKAIAYHNWRKFVSGAPSPNRGNWQDPTTMKRFASVNDRAFYCESWPDGLRDLGDAHEVARRRINHTGWWCDDYQGAKAIGRVLQLPARDGKPRYITGVYNTDCDGVTLYPLDWYEEKEDAAGIADQRAEYYAEAEREYNAKDQAEQQTDELKDRIIKIRQEIRAIVREMKAHQAVKDAPTICQVLRGEINSLRRESHKAYKRIEALADNYWLAVDN